jgi:ribosome maturation factor RimP
MKKDKRAEVEEAIKPILEWRNLELVDIQLKKEPRGLVLRIFLDKEGGIDLDTITEASEAISAALDSIEPIPGRYILEVSSPGIERPLNKPENFKRFLGERVEVRTEEPIAGRRKFTGILMTAGEKIFTIKCDEREYEIAYKNVLKAHLKPELKF